MLKLKTTITIGLLILFQNFTNAQEDQVQQYLQKTGVIDSLYSKTLQESRTIYIKLPENYSSEMDQKYPVAFILDGELYLPTVSEVHKYYSGGFIPEMVLVGISNSKNRTRDLTTSIIKTKYGTPFNEPNGEAANFSKFLAEELFPYIESNYPVTNFRTLIGHSYGGLFTIYALLHHPTLFANYIAIDPSLDWDDQNLLKDAKGLLSSQRYTNKSLFMSLSGQLHWQDSSITIDNVMEDTTEFTMFARSNIAFSNVVKENANNGLVFNWKFYPKDIHGTIPFPSIMDGLIATFEWYQMENTDKINSFDTSKEELLSITNYREQKLKDHFGYSEPPYPESLLNMKGYMNLDMQQIEKAKMYFELAMLYYPNSANTFDSMADYYSAQNDPQNALKYITKAYELSGDDYYKERMDTLREKSKTN